MRRLRYDTEGSSPVSSGRTTPPNSTGFAYDAEGNRTTVEDAKGRLTHFSYDDRNRLVSIHQAADFR